MTSNAGGDEAATTTYRNITYEPGFDGIRGTGAIFAVTAHASMIVLPSFDNKGLPELLPGTFVFMDAFFVLSGFLITALLLKEQQSTGEIGILRFYRRRALRLFPALWLLLAVHFVYAHISHHDMALEWETIRSVSTYTVNFRMNNILTARVATGLTQLWSLSLEEQFYLIWPVVVIFILPLRRRLRTTVIILVSAIVFISIRRYYLWENGADWLRLFTHTDTRADSILFGALLAYLWVHNKTPKKYLPIAAWIATAFIAWGIIELDLTSSFPIFGGYNLLALAWGVILLAAIDGRWVVCHLISSRLFRLLGRVSYGIFLWHVPIQFAVAEHGQNLPPMARLALASLLTFLVVAFSWKFVEQPVIRYKDRLERAARAKEGLVIGSSADARVRGPESDPNLDDEVHEPSTNPGLGSETGAGPVAAS